MVNEETTVKISKWLLDEIENFSMKTKRNLSEFPTKRNFVDMAVIGLLEERGVKLNSRRYDG